MIVDKREEILARLVEVSWELASVKGVYRNKDELSDTARPAIVILDGDEAVDDTAVSQGIATQGFDLIKMNPQILILAGTAPEDVGTVLNGIRVALIKAIYEDAALNALVGVTDMRRPSAGSGAIRYEGCASAFSQERKTLGDMGLSFAFVYVLRPSDL